MASDNYSMVTPFSTKAVSMTSSSSSSFPKRSLPETLWIGYATECNEKVIRAIREGLNVIIWSFCELHHHHVDYENNDDEDSQSAKRDGKECTSIPNVRLETNSLDLDCIQKLITQLDDEGYDHVVHLVSFGGWNGPHLDPNLDATEWYDAYQKYLGTIFHGIDWDLEGHDDTNSPTNEFTWECLDKMGKISQLMKADGYIVGMAPPQSYLDVSSSTFSRKVTLTRYDRKECNNNKNEDCWHSEFSYFGNNVYAYLLAKYGTENFDFISIQFYESYSIAGKYIYHEGMSPEDYLISYVTEFVEKNNETYSVNFGNNDDNNNDDTKPVFLPRSKLVWGFANAWAMDTTEKDKVVYFPPESIKRAYQYLSSKNLAPRGCMMWVIGEEGGGKHGIRYVPAISSILFGED